MLQNASTKMKIAAKKISGLLDLRPILPWNSDCTGLVPNEGYVR
jgi:hypothetical protein